MNAAGGPLRAAVFFDRDGVLNQAEVRDGQPYPPRDAAAMLICPEAAAAIQALKAAGYLCLCVTNQPDVARGLRTLANVRAMNERVRRELALDDLSVCLHDDHDHCACRKPKPGLLLEAAAKWGLDLGRCWMIGDRAGDVEAGRAAGCRTIFLNRDYREAPPAPPADHSRRTLSEAVAVILAGQLTA